MPRGKEKKHLVIATIRMVLLPENRKKVLDIFRGLLGPIKVEPGCLGCRLYQDLENENLIVFEEVWESQNDLDRHINSEKYRHILVALDMSSKPPEINFNNITSTAGMEAIGAALGRNPFS